MPNTDNVYKKEKDKERVVNISCLVMCAAILVFSSYFLSKIFYIDGVASPMTTHSIVLAATCLFGIVSSTLYLLYLILIMIMSMTPPTKPN